MKTIENLNNIKQISIENMSDYLLTDITNNPNYYMFENNLFTFARKFIDGYNGGRWDCMEIQSNDVKGFFMLFNGDDDVEYNVNNTMNGTSAKLTRLQSSIFLNLMAFSHASFDCADFGDYYHILFDYVYIEFNDDKEFLLTLYHLLD